MTQYGIIETPWGRIGVEISAAGVRRVRFHVSPDVPLRGEWAQVFAAYLAGQPFPDDLPVDLTGVPAFTRRVLLACRAVPFGQTISYGTLAGKLGCPRSARAVGQALARNPVPLVIPCHRVLGTHGALTGFLGGVNWKRELLCHEGMALNG